MAMGAVMHEAKLFELQVVGGEEEGNNLRTILLQMQKRVRKSFGNEASIPS